MVTDLLFIILALSVVVSVSLFIYVNKIVFNYNRRIDELVRIIKAQKDNNLFLATDCMTKTVLDVENLINQQYHNITNYLELMQRTISNEPKKDPYARFRGRDGLLSYANIEKNMESSEEQDMHEVKIEEEVGND